MTRTWLDFLRTLALPSLLLLTFACSDPQPPRMLQLDITDEGHYVLEGKGVTVDDLRSQLRAMRATGTPLQLRINGSPGAGFESVGLAVKAAQDAGVDGIGFVTQPAPTATARP